MTSALIPNGEADVLLAKSALLYIDKLSSRLKWNNICLLIAY